MQTAIKTNRFAAELAFTDAYRQYEHAPIAIREAMCLRAQFPAYLSGIRDNDLFAGRLELGMVCFSPEQDGFAYCSELEEVANQIEACNLSDEEQRTFAELRDFWRDEATRAKLRRAYPEPMATWLPSDRHATDSHIAFPLYRMAGAQLDFGKLVRLGIPGMKREIAERQERARHAGEDEQLFIGMLMCLELLEEVCLHYAKQTRQLAEGTADSRRRSELARMERVLLRIRTDKPATMREAIQLAWLYSLLAGVRNYSRMDVYLGDLYVQDLVAGRMTNAQALALLQSFWQLIADKKTIYNGRVIVGGRGRPNEANADRFALLAMEATRTVLEVEPQLSLRFYEGMNPALMEKALVVIGEGRTFPILYNDDINVPAAAAAFDIPHEAAEQYLPYGCGEYVIDHQSYGTPSGTINLLKALELTLHNGVDPTTGRRIGIETGDLAQSGTFDDLFQAYKRQVEHFVDILADQEELEYRFAGETAPFLYLSMLYDDCIERGKGIFAGGIRYLGGTLETYGNINTADSLTAIRKLVYEERKFTLAELVRMLDADFAGYTLAQQQLRQAPKYGNDDDAADAMAIAVHEHISHTARNQRERTHLHSYMNVMINNSMNTIFGRTNAASADGRGKGKPLANANNPSGGCDRKGVTAFMNSLVKLDPSIHAGAVQNMKFGKELFTAHKEKLRALLDTYFANGGTQAMISVVSRDELEKAMKEPEKYTHLFVRVGGFSARFVELSQDVQEEILSRTLY